MNVKKMIADVLTANPVYEEAEDILAAIRRAASNDRYHMFSARANLLDSIAYSIETYLAEPVRDEEYGCCECQHIDSPDDEYPCSDCRNCYGLKWERKPVPVVVPTCAECGDPLPDDGDEPPDVCEICAQKRVEATRSQGLKTRIAASLGNGEDVDVKHKNGAIGEVVNIEGDSVVVDISGFAEPGKWPLADVRLLKVVSDE